MGSNAKHTHPIQLDWNKRPYSIHVDLLNINLKYSDVQIIQFTHKSPVQQVCGIKRVEDNLISIYLLSRLKRYSVSCVNDDFSPRHEDLSIWLWKSLTLFKLGFLFLSSDSVVQLKNIPESVWIYGVLYAYVGFWWISWR